MADDRIITLRFKTGNALDTELYRKLETEKRELGLSMPVYVKEIMRRHFESGEGNADSVADIVVGQVQKVIREEMASLGGCPCEYTCKDGREFFREHWQK